MKLKVNDPIIVIAGRDKGKTGQVARVLPSRAEVVVEGINVVKRNTKPSAKHPRGGILESPRPITVAKLAYLEDNLPTRIGYKFNAAGEKERISRRTGKVLKPGTDHKLS